MKTANLVKPYHQNNIYKSMSTTNENKNEIKATAGVNPSGRLSFKGNPAKDAAKVAKKAAEKLKQAKAIEKLEQMPLDELKKTFSGKLVQNKTFNKFLDVISGNTLIADALIALGFTAILRPASIYAIPAKDKHERKKNNYQVAHSVATGLMGLGTTIAVAEPLKRGIDKVLSNPDKFKLKNGVQHLKDNKGIYKEVAGRFHQPFFLPIRAILTIMIVPPLLKTLGLTKHPTQMGITPSDKAKIDYSFLAFKGTNKRMFNSFSSVNSAFSKAEKNQKKPVKTNYTPSFKGGLGGKVTNGIAKGVAKVFDTDRFKKFIDKFKQTNWFPHLIAGESLWLSSFYMFQSGKSKKIEKDQKLPMILNQGITAVLCTMGAYKLDGVINKRLDRLKVVYQRMNPNVQGEALASKLKGVRYLGPLVIFTAIYRFVGPVIVTPIANKISEMIQPHKKSSKQQPAMATAK